MRRLALHVTLATMLGLALRPGAIAARAQDESRPLPPTASAGDFPAPPTPPTPPTPAPDPAPALRRALDALYLTETERSALRVFHGLWSAADLTTPGARARAALALGVFDDPALSDAASDPEDRADAALARGGFDEALALVADSDSLRAVRIRASALEGLGRFEEADRAVQPVTDRLLRSPLTSAPDLTEAARALRIRARLQGRPAGDFTNLMALLGRASQELDRLYWPAILEQADLLYDKDNSREAVDAALETLSLNPRCARAWAILGRVSVDAFDFGRAEGVARRIEENEREWRGLAPEGAVASPLAEAIRARAALRQNDPELALGAVKSALTRYPGERQCFSLEVAAVALSYDWESLEAALARFDQVSPGSPLALFEAGRALSENRQYGRAADYLARARERQPNWPQPVIELGLLEMQSGRDQQALEALRRATALDEFNVRARNSRTLIEELVTYETVESEHFTIRYRAGTDEVLAREMPGPLEEIYRIGTGVSGRGGFEEGSGVEFEPGRKTVIELLPDHEWFAVRITGMTGIHTIAASTGPVIAMESPREGKKHFGVYDWVRVLRHEFVHTVTLARTDYRIPLWFTEAAAVFLENGPLDYPTAQMLVGALTNDALFDMNEENTAFVRPRNPNDRAQAYAQGHWMYRFIRERWGPRAPLAMMDLYAQGRREDAVMRSVLGLSQSEFLSAFRQWARDDARSWGMLPEKSFLQLLREESFADPLWRAEAEAKLEVFTLVAAASPSPAHALRWLDLSLLEPTIETLDRLLARNPGNPEVLEFKAGALAARNGGEATPAMIPTLEAYASARPVDPMPHRHLARLYLNSEAPEKSIPHLAYLDAREQHSSAYAVELAKRYAAIKDWDRAWPMAIRATRLAPFDPAGRELAASVAIQRGDLAEAERLIETLTVLEPQQDIHRLRLARIREMRAKNR